jgi:MFS family permease
MAAVFAAQGWGQFSAALVSLIITTAFKNSIIKDGIVDPKHVDNMWRLLIGIGMVPAVCALYFRLTIPETPRFTMDVERNYNQAKQDVDAMIEKGKFVVDPDAVIQRVEAPKASWKDFFRHFSKWQNGKVLLGTSYSWFALDIAFYGLGLNSSIVLKAIGFGTPTGTGGLLVYNNLKAISVGNIILSVGGLIPGYYATLLLVDSWGRRPIQLMGFSLLTVIFCCMGASSFLPPPFFYSSCSSTAPFIPSPPFPYIYSSLTPHIQASATTNSPQQPKRPKPSFSSTVSPISSRTLDRIPLRLSSLVKRSPHDTDLPHMVFRPRAGSLELSLLRLGLRG